MKPKDSFLNKYPITLSNGFIGLGKSLEQRRETPYFFVKEFNSSKEEYFQPEHYFKSDELEISEKSNEVISNEDFPSKEALKEDIKTFIQDDSSLEKIVLAQRRQYTFKDKIDPLTIIAKLIKSFPTENIFAYCPSPDKIFFGSSPERLYTRDKENIVVDCIAGTAELNERDELFSEKNKKEHRFVTSFVEDALEELAVNIKTSALGTKEAKNLLHLYQTVGGTIKPTMNDFDIISRLHPTPAVLGFPKKEALTFLKKHEQFNRGYYAGCIGWMEPNKTLLHVAIRSGVVEYNTLTLFAGAGITKESDPELEIIEINNKFKTLEGVFLDYTLST